MADVVVTDHPEQSRYEARVGDTLAGFAQYQLTSELIVFTHTEVGDAFEGQGVGSALVQQALDHVRAGGSRKVLPLCPFVKGWISRHRDYVDLVYGAPASRVRDGRAAPPATGGTPVAHPSLPHEGRPQRAGCRRGASPRGGPTSLGAKTKQGRAVHGTARRPDL